MVGQPEAAVTSVEVGVGVTTGGVVVVLVMVTLPPLPGDAISLGPQLDSASAPQPTRSKLLKFFTANPFL